MGNEFDLMVHVPADDWAFCQRRLVYLETLLVSVVRHRSNIQEWYDAEHLARLRLPGIPADKGAVTRKANACRWRCRRSGKHKVYHVTSLPAQAFDALIARILDLPEMDEEPPTTAVPQEGPLLLSDPSTPNTAPPWVLPLMRLMRGSAKGDIAKAWRDLPDHLPRGLALPSPDEAATILVDLGLSEKLANWSEH